MPKSDDLAVRWSRRWSLTHRILAINIFALAILAGSLFYLDSFRARLTSARTSEYATQARMIADTMALVPPSAQPGLLGRLGIHSGTRLRVYDASGAKRLDSWTSTGPTYTLIDPEQEPWRKDVARILDNALDAAVGAEEPPPFLPVRRDHLAAWPEAARALKQDRLTAMLRRAPDGTAFISAAAPVAGEAETVLLLTTNDRSIRRIVRAERLTLGIILAATILLSVLLSLFLARTIARPLRHLARAAHLVRLGREREVAVPRLPARRDEIGLLARALSDMTQALRRRIDATEAFAADVTHELKNPLASLRSAVDSLERVDDPQLRARLLDVVRDDVHRLDRLIVDIADISRLDAELSRARFEQIDVGRLIEDLLPAWERRAGENNVRIAFARPGVGAAVLAGDEGRLGRALDNLVDNAISFSPPEGLVEIAAARLDDELVVSIEDQGPGIPAAARERIFDRFHSDRPETETFGKHSGLGLAIARAIVEGHAGRLLAGERQDGSRGARFTIRLPVTP